MIKKIAIFGTSGFAYEVADIAYALGITDIVLLSKEDIDGNLDSRINILPESKVKELSQCGYEFAIGVGEPSVRKKIYIKYSYLTFPNLIHPNATLGYGQKEKFKKTLGNIIAPGVVFTNNIVVGNFGIFNLNCTVGHDCIIGDYVSVMPSVNVSGNVQIKDSVFIGVGAVILQGSLENKVILGVNSLVGAASLVTKNVEDNFTVFGVPAKPIKK